MIYNFQNITVLGAGKSGVGAAILASKQNLNVVVYNDSNICLLYTSPSPRD